MERDPDRRLPRRPPPVHTLTLVLAEALALLVILLLIIWLRGEAWLQPALSRIGIDRGPGLSGWDSREWTLWAFQVATITPSLRAFGAVRSDGGVVAWRAVLIVAMSGAVLSTLLVSLQVANVSRPVLGAAYVSAAAAVPMVAKLLANRWRAAWLRPGPLRVVEVIPEGGVACLTSDGSRRIITAVRLAGATDEAALRTGATEDKWPAVVDVAPADLEAALHGMMAERLAVQVGALDAHRSQMFGQAEEHGLDLHLIIPGHAPPRGEPPMSWGGAMAVNLRSTPQRTVAWSVKRAMDVGGAVVGLVLFAPVLLLALLALKIEDRGLPMFYGGRRVGLKGHKFRMWKINTMVSGANAMEVDLQEGNEREGPWFKVDSGNDPRLTRVGRFLRKYSLNEIPQFWNILVGDMSLVGPRPPTPDEVRRYIDYDVRYFQCLDVKPGLTGLWQVKAKDDPSFDRRIELDVQYIRNWSIWLDIKLLFLTFWSVVSKPET